MNDAAGALAEKVIGVERAKGTDAFQKAARRCILDSKHPG